MVALGSELVRDGKFVARRDDLGVDAGRVPHMFLADVAEVGLLEQQQLLHVGPLKEFAKQGQELLLLGGREFRPVLIERRPAHRVSVQEVLHQGRQGGQFLVVRLVTVDNCARLLKRGLRVLQWSHCRPGWSRQTDQYHTAKQNPAHQSRSSFPVRWRKRCSRLRGPILTCTAPEARLSVCWSGARK